MTDIRLQDFTEADLDWIADAEVTIFGPSAWSRALIREDYRWGHNRYRGVQVDGQWGAYAIYGFDGDAFHLFNLAVVPTMRRQGLARLLLDEVIAEATRLAASEVWLEVAVNNDAALALYRAYGFEPVRVRRKYYQPGDIDALVMRRVVHPYEPDHTATNL